MMFISFLQRLGFRSEPLPDQPAKPAPVARNPRQASAAPVRPSNAPVGEPIGGITQGLPASSASVSASGASPRSNPSAPRHAPSGTERRPVVKALDKKTATTAQPAKVPARSAAAGEIAAKTAAEKSVKIPPKSATPAKPPATQPSGPSAKRVTQSAVPVKSTAEADSPAAAKTPPETLVRSVTPTASKPVTKPATPASAKAPAASKPAQQTKPAAVAPVAKAASSAAKSASSKTQPTVEPTPRPLGKRAAKKVMMEQMTQAEVLPTHAPDAAKATFSSTNERVVMTPPVPSAIRKDPKRANNWKTLPVDQLTDEDIMAMPDDGYMSDLQLAYFRRKLSQLRADMLANAGQTTEHLREDTVVVPDPADRATIEEEHALELRTRDRERKLLKKIEQSIGRIDAGDYGYCDETGEPIGVGRLLARPTATLSLEAQQRRELKQKMFGD